MMSHVMDFPRGEGSVEYGINPGVALPSTNPGGEIVDSAQGGDTQGRTVHAGLESFVTAVADDRQHKCPVLPSMLQGACLTACPPSPRVSDRVIIQIYLVSSVCWT